MDHNHNVDQVLNVNVKQGKFYVIYIQFLIHLTHTAL